MGHLVTKAFPFDQGVRDKLPNPQLGLDLFGIKEEDVNLPREAWDELLAWLQRQKLGFHNAKFDLHMMRVGTRHWPGVDLVVQFWWDTMLAAGILDPLEMRGLDAQVQRLGLGSKKGMDEVKGWLSRNKHPKGRYDLVPWDIIEGYVTADTEMTAALLQHQLNRLKDPDLAPVLERIQRDFDLTRALYCMEARGIRYDDARSMEAADKLEAEANEIEKRMPFIANGTGAMGYFVKKLKLETDRSSEKTGRPTIDEEQVRKWVKEEVPWAREYAEVTKKRRAVSMWYRGYPEKIGRDGRLRTTFRQGHVKSGRMSVERVQLQALPKKDKNIEGIPGIRELILAEEGCGLWNLDLSQAELRVASHYAQCVNMLKQLADGEDIHSNTTRQVIHVDEDHPNWKEKRDIAKRLTFGGIFQIGPDTFQATLSKLADLHLPISECQDLIWGWRRMYPEFGVAYRKAEKKMEGDGFVRLLPNTEYEMKSYLGPRDWPRTGWNRMVQGSLALAFGFWLGEIEKRWPGYAILTVHDSIVIEAPLSEGQPVAEEIAAFGAEFMTNIFGIEMKVDVDGWTPEAKEIVESARLAA
jgi:DNA polymerase I-like protein with 3'-5' exonuclease and polymerase domains